MLPILAQIPSGFHRCFDDQHRSFTQYIEQTREMITQARIDLDGDDAEKIIDVNSPFEYRPKNFDGKRGILLVHGLCDSPFWMRDLAQFFLEQNFLVRALLLPGHGTRSGDLLHINYQDWFNAVNYGMRSFNGEVERKYFCGFSTGAALGIHYALHHDDVSALLLFSLAYEAKSQDWLYNHLSNVQRYLSEADNWVITKKYYDYAKYSALPMNAPWQLQHIIDSNREELKKYTLSLPIFMAQSADDETVLSEPAVDFFCQQSNPKSRLVYYSNKQEKWHDERIHYQSGIMPEENTLSISHVSLVIAPDNPHYGRHKDYDYPIYYNDKVEDKTLHQGALSNDMLKRYNYTRLTYQPDFTQLMQRIKTFLDTLN